MRRCDVTPQQSVWMLLWVFSITYLRFVVTLIDIFIDIKYVFILIGGLLQFQDFLLWLVIMKV